MIHIYRGRLANQPARKLYSLESVYKNEAVAKAQLGRYVRTGLFPLFKFPFLDDNFKIDGKPYQHYVKLCSPLVGHTLIGNAKNEYIKLLWGNNLRVIRIQLGNKRNAVIHQMW
jgi:hypothetical protein